MKNSRVSWTGSVRCSCTCCSIVGLSSTHWIIILSQSWQRSRQPRNMAASVVKHDMTRSRFSSLPTVLPREVSRSSFAPDRVVSPQRYDMQQVPERRVKIGSTFPDPEMTDDISMDDFENGSDEEDRSSDYKSHQKRLSRWSCLESCVCVIGTLFCSGRWCSVKGLNADVTSRLLHLLESQTLSVYLRCWTLPYLSWWIQQVVSTTQNSKC